MTDEKLEQHLRDLPVPALPETWRAEILAQARRAARSSSQKRPVWPPLLVYLRNLCVRNPITAGAMAALWMLIFAFKTGTPVDPDERMLLAHFDPNRPIYLASISNERLLDRLLREQDEPEQKSNIQIQ